MTESASPFLTVWSNFYVMTGSSAAALTGLMFVVITLVTGNERRERSQDGIAAFSTPTVMHFGAALLVSAVLCAPWRSLIYPGATIGLAALYGAFSVLRATYRTSRLTTYRPDLEDWTWYFAVPLCAYGATLGGAIALAPFPREALFVMGAGVLLLIFIGIRNAWDVVTFLAVQGG